MTPPKEDCPSCGAPVWGVHRDTCPRAEERPSAFAPIFPVCGNCGHRHAIGDFCVTSDNVNHPDHYQSATGLECIDAIRAALTSEEFRGYCKGAALKYIWREAKKGGNESLAKGVWYLNEAQK